MLTAYQIIKDLGVFQLGGYDGCLCTSFALQKINVDVSCRKSSGGVQGIDPDFYGTVVRVYSNSLGANAEELQNVAKEVAKQLRENDGCALIVRYCDWQHDNDKQCNCCGKPREAAAYLCVECASKAEALPYDYRDMDFTIPAD